MRKILLTLAVLPLMPLNEASAFYCSEPTAPSCASRYGSFDDEWEFERCKREMDSYKDEVESYIDCNNQQARRENDDAISNYSSAVDSFNRRARN